MRNKISSSKKMLIASMLVGVLLIGAVITIVAVLAAQTQAISSQITISYVVDGVGAKVSATYAVVPNEGDVEKLSMTGDGGNELTFGVNDSSTTKQLNPAEINLSSTTRKVVYEYKFTNIAESAFTISLTDQPAKNNMNVYYKVSATEISASQYKNASTFVDTSALLTQAITEVDRDMYIYIVVEIANVNKSASYDGNMEWTLLNVDNDTLVEIGLDNDNDGSADDSFKIVPNVAMPIVYDKPTNPDGRSFAGYETASGTQYVNADGTSAHVADLSAGSVLSALWVANMFELDGTTITGLTALGATQTQLVIPNDVTAIADGAIENNTVVEVVTYESAESLSYSDGSSSLVSIGANAFKNCTSLTTLYIPESVTSIGSMAFANTTALENVYFNAINCADLCDLVAYTLEMPFAYSGTAGDGINVVFGKDVLRVPAGLFMGNLLSEDETEMQASIPKTISVSFAENATCKELGMASFMYNVYLQTVTVPASLNKVEMASFAYCTSLQSATFEDASNWYAQNGSVLQLVDVSDPTSNAQIAQSLEVDVISGTYDTITRTNSTQSTQYLSVNAYFSSFKYDSVSTDIAGDEYIILKAGESVEVSYFVLKGETTGGSIISIATSKPSDIDTKLFYTNYGAYPQTYVGNDLNATLSALNDTYKTGKTYTTDIAGTATTLEEYLYNGKKYAKLSKIDANGSDYTFSDGTTIVETEGTVYFFKVEPIVVKAMEAKGNGQYNVMVTNLLGSKAFDKTTNPYDNSWKNSDLREYLNGTFLTDSGLSEVAVEVTISNEDYFNTSPDDSDTTDKIWLPSAEEMMNWTGTDFDAVKSTWMEDRYISDSNDSLRMKTTSDLARATYAYTNTNYGTGWYFLRSAGAYSDRVCSVDSLGTVYTTLSYGTTYYAFSPAFLINL